MRLITGGDDVLDEQQPTFWPHRPAAVAQDCCGLAVVPGMDDGGEQVGISARGHRVKATAADPLTPVLNPGRTQDLVRTSDHLRSVEQDALHLWIDGQYGGEQAPMAAAYIDERPDAGEVEGGQEPGVALQI